MTEKCFAVTILRFNAQLLFEMARLQITHVYFAPDVQHA